MLGGLKIAEAFVLDEFLCKNSRGCFTRGLWDGSFEGAALGYRPVASRGVFCLPRPNGHKQTFAPCS